MSTDSMRPTRKGIIFGFVRASCNPCNFTDLECRHHGVNESLGFIHIGAVIKREHYDVKSRFKRVKANKSSPVLGLVQ